MGGGKPGSLRRNGIDIRQKLIEELHVVDRFFGKGIDGETARFALESAPNARR